MSKMWWVKRDCIYGNCGKRGIYKVSVKRFGNEPLTHTILYCRKHLIDRIKSWSVDATWGKVIVTRVDKRGMVNSKGRAIA